MDPRGTRTVVDPRTSLALWLRAGRAHRQLTLDDVARVTKIQPRILEKLESGQLDGLPAEVFVRGFVKSFARCVGLDESEAIERFGACAGLAATPATTAARAFVETLVAAPARVSATPRAAAGTPSTVLPVVIELEPSEPTVIEPSGLAAADRRPGTVMSAIEVIELAPTTEDVPAPKKRRAPRKKTATGPPAARSRKKKLTTDVLAAERSSTESTELASSSTELLASSSTELLASSSTELLASSSTELLAASSTSELAASSSTELAASSTSELFAASTELAERVAPAIDVVDHTSAPLEELALAAGSEPVIVSTSNNVRAWQPTMPAVVPWKRPMSASTAAKLGAAYVMPKLVIDDADPEVADQERDAREAERGPQRVSFLPPILLDRDDRSGRQGGLTLAVIILLIAATLTLSYLMRRPSVSGDGVTSNEPIATSTLLATIAP